MMRTVCTVLAIELGIFLGVYTADVLAQSTAVHLTGRVSAIAEEAEEGRFQIIGDSGSLVIDVASWDYITDYMRAMNGREVTITIDPKE